MQLEDMKKKLKKVSHWIIVDKIFCSVPDLKRKKK